MAAAPLRTAFSAAALLPRLAAPQTSASATAAVSASLTSTIVSSSLISLRTFRAASLFARQIAATPYLPAFSIAFPSISSFLEGIWESVLRAVPKKKTSHMKKRHRQMAGKALRDVKALCQCPACGRTKRQHHVCPHCMESIREMLKKST
ncbi:wd domain-containing protein [Ophiostoma piceae UAMH 11346]|uniref:Large ribosomal subunit protein bL32m n=1 Tax=Ophiostoma piceae (strain UAMH 11346) TaxID=1262450 RepID=S3C6M9_OPHP1|nr:wd domain-containing protein [Ophiostoma piceae UAMH 11346]